LHAESPTPQIPKVFAWFRLSRSFDF